MLTDDTGHVPLNMSHYSQHRCIVPFQSVCLWFRIPNEHSADVYVQRQSFTSVPYPESESKLRSNLLVLK